MSKTEARRRLQAVDPSLTIISGKKRKHPYVLKPEEAYARGLPDLPGRTPPNEILELEGQYSLKQLRMMCSENRLSPEGDKEQLVRRLIKKGVLEIPSGQGVLMQTKKINKECFLCGRTLRAKNSLYYIFDNNIWRVSVCSVCYSGAPNKTVQTAIPWSTKPTEERKSRVMFLSEGVKVDKR